MQQGRVHSSHEYGVAVAYPARFGVQERVQGKWGIADMTPRAHQEQLQQVGRMTDRRYASMIA